jgi:hypothetical protein
VYNKLKKPLGFLDKISRGFLVVFPIYFVNIFKYNELRKKPKLHSEHEKRGYCMKKSGEGKEGGTRN